MNAKEIAQRGYDLFNTGDMETFFGELIADDITWTFPGDNHPLSGEHHGKMAMMETMMKIPTIWNNFSVSPEFMISEGNKVFTKGKMTADGIDTIFGHFMEVNDDGKLITMMTFDDTLTMFNAM